MKSTTTYPSNQEAKFVVSLEFVLESVQYVEHIILRSVGGLSIFLTPFASKTGMKQFEQLSNFATKNEKEFKLLNFI